MTHSLATLIEAIEGPTLLVLRITVLLAIAWALEALARRWNPRWRVLLWRQAAVGVVVLAIAGSLAPRITWRVLPPVPAVASATTPILPTPLPGLPQLPSDILRPTRQPPLASAPLTVARVPLQTQRETTAAEPKPARPLPNDAEPATSPNAGVRIGTVAAVVWLVGVVALAARLVVGVRRVRQIAAQASPAPAEVRSLAEAIAPLCGADPSPDLRQSDAAIAPCSTGVFHPVVLLPTELCRTGTTTELRGALAHELAHLSGHDLVWNALIEVVSIACWFHPFAWRMRLAHADACDERCDAVAASVTNDADGYAQLLARVALAVAGSTPTAALPMARTPRVLRRIRLLPLGRGRTRVSRGRAVLAGGMLALVSVVLGTTALDRRAAAAPPATTDTASSAVTENKVDDTPGAASAPLSGRITDNAGEPVTDASVTLTGTRSGGETRNYYEARTDAEGRYMFSKIDADDTFRLRVESKKWVGLTDWRNAPQLKLSPNAAVVRDMTLSRACLVRLRVVDEAGEPIDDAMVYAKNLAADRYSATPSKGSRDDGWAEIGGLSTSPAEYRFGVSSKSHGFGMTQVKLTEVGQTVEATITLPKGAEVQGVAICSDGKPAAGWRISVLPDWWVFNSYPLGVEVGATGEFVCPHITPGKYDVSVSIPEGGGMSRSVPLLSSQPLPPADGPLRLSIDSPSPQGLGTLSGKLVLTGVAPKEMISIDATNEDTRQYRGSTRVRPGDAEFKIEALPPGLYRIEVTSTEVETVTLRSIAVPRAPTDKPLEIPVEVRGRPKLVGRVVDRAGQPVTSFRLRATKVGYTRGPNYVQDAAWIATNDPDGRFEIDVVGPGIYTVSAQVPGAAPTTSASINTDQLPDGPITLKLSGGATLRGTVVDEEGRPVDGASVTPRASASPAPSPYPQVVTNRTEAKGSVRTVNGKFELTRLAAGREQLRVTHPDYAVALSDEVTLSDGAHGDTIELPPITLRRGATVSGVVYDRAGQPRPDATIIFHDRSGFGSISDQIAGRLAVVITDDAGHYVARHLPEQLCYVHLEEEWDKDGVVRTAILPRRSGEESTLDLGGPGGFAGRLLVAGAPATQVRVQLAGESPHFGVFKAYARTDADGRFTFPRPTAGGRTLWFQTGGRNGEWIRVTDVEFPADTPAGATIDLGDVDYRAVTVAITPTGLPAETLASSHMRLREYDPYWLDIGRELGTPVPRTTADAPSVFQNIPPAQIEATLQLADGASYSEVVEVTDDRPEQAFKITWPSETGALQANLATELCSGGSCQGAKVLSIDGHVVAYLRASPDKPVARLEHLPAGDYYVTDKGVRDAPHTLEFTITAGETTTIDVTPDDLDVTLPNLGLVILNWFTPEGVPLTGVEGTIQSAAGEAIYRLEKQDAKWTAVGAPGDYAVTAKFPGYAPLEARVTVAPPGPDGRIVGEPEVDLTFAPH